MKKYSLTKNTKEWCGRTLFQIKAERSFGNVKKGEIGENGEHDCIDGTDGTANIDGTDGCCTVCGLTDLI